MMLPCLLLLVVGFASAAAETGQTTAPGARLRVFLDCGRDCFSDYLRDEITFVDFVRQPQDADVHVFSSSRDTGGGGREVTLRFVGLGRFTGHDEVLRAVSLTGDTENTRRELVLRTAEVALLAFIAREGLPTDVRVSIETARETESRAPADDPWNAWVFSIRGSANLEAEESSRERSWDLNLGADRITELWKITFGASLDQENEEFDLDEDDPLEVVRREREAEWFVARSRGPHWSFGLDGRVESSTFGNTKFAFNTAPAVEYSVFPYEEYATRQLRIQYSLGVAHARYNEFTLFDRFEETRPIHEASIRLDRREPWGSLDASLEFSQYLHDTSKYRLELDGEVSFRITRGLSFDVEGGVSRIRDQLSLPRRDATPEEVLLRLRELQSEYEFRFDVGFTYSFGSFFNNVVNPRFGR
ncbi:MAG TPA: hypothetical protein VMM93_02975 [Vicinamibacterales bacterium]|nr:hypothetical protein [Vicinamibacterales bacterium]